VVSPGSPTTVAVEPKIDIELKRGLNAPVAKVNWSLQQPPNTSFTVPLGPLKQRRAASSEEVLFDINVVPAVWPLCGCLTQAPRGNSSPGETDYDITWKKFELTVDVIAAAGLPPLLSCVCTSSNPKGSTCSQSGNPNNIQSSTGSIDDHIGSWVKIYHGNGILAATISHEERGFCVIERWGAAPDGSNDCWYLNSRAGDGDGHMVSIARADKTVIGQGVAMRRGDLSECEDDSAEYLQVDTILQTRAPESIILLMCICATMAF